MILVYLSGDECIEVPEAVSVDQRDGDFVCLDTRGRVVASFDQSKVEAFTSNPEIMDAILENVCVELNVVPPSGGL